jgi:hypothetical protein
MCAIWRPGNGSKRVFCVAQVVDNSIQRFSWEAGIQHCGPCEMLWHPFRRWPWVPPWHNRRPIAQR